MPLIPFRFRSIPRWLYDGDGLFDHNRIKGKSKRFHRKKQIRKMLKTALWSPRDNGASDY